MTKYGRLAGKLRLYIGHYMAYHALDIAHMIISIALHLSGRADAIQILNVLTRNHTGVQPSFKLIGQPHWHAWFQSRNI